MAYINDFIKIVNISLIACFYEADTVYIGTKTSNEPGLSTNQQSIFVMLLTDKENNYSKYVKLAIIPTDNQYYMSKFAKMNSGLVTLNWTVFKRTVTIKKIKSEVT